MIVLPAATSEYVDVPVTSTGDPTSMSWEVALSTASTSSVEAAPDTGWVASAADDNGAEARPRYTIRVPVDGVDAGTYGMWIRVAAGPYVSPVRFAGRLRLY